MRLLGVVLACVGFSAFAQESTLTIETVAADRKLWPREVTVSVAHEVPIVVNGKSSGSMKAPAGRSYPVKSVSASGVVVDALGSPLTFATAETDVLARAQDAQARQAAQAAAATPPPVAAATPAPALKAAATPTPAPAATNALAGKLTGKLVTFGGKKFERFDASQLGTKKYLAIYFSASWCGPCRQFTPELVKMYKLKKSSRDKFDVVFVSRDRSEDDMKEYMKGDDMEWPAVAFEKIDNSPLMKYGGKGIPRLVIVDEQGKVVSDSYEGDNYVGPTKVMKDLERLIKGS